MMDTKQNLLIFHFILAYANRESLLIMYYGHTAKQE